MGRSTRRLSAAAVGTIILFAGCGGSTEPNDGGGGGGPPPPPDYELDPTIPDIPIPTAPQPTTIVFSEPGVPTVIEYTKPTQTTVVAVWHHEVFCGIFDPACIETYNSEQSAFEFSLFYYGIGHSDCEVTSTVESVYNGQGEDETILGYTLRSACITFHPVDLGTIVKSIGAIRYWQNVTSRVLGPGTSYSITYRWSEGTTSTNGYEWSTTTGSRKVDETSWNNCVGGSVKTSVEGDIGVVKAKAEVEVHDEYCNGETHTQETSRSLSETFNESRSVTSESGGEETTSVSGAEDADRVYDVWQLVEQYVYLDVKGDTLSKEVLDILPPVEEIRVYVDTLRHPNLTTPLTTDLKYWTVAGIVWPNGGSLKQRTPLFVQSTTDFLRSGSISGSRQRVLDIQSW